MKRHRPAARRARPPQKDLHDGSRTTRHRDPEPDAHAARAGRAVPCSTAGCRQEHTWTAYDLSWFSGRRESTDGDGLIVHAVEAGWYCPQCRRDLEIECDGPPLSETLAAHTGAGEPMPDDAALIHALNMAGDEPAPHAAALHEGQPERRPRTTETIPVTDQLAEEVRTFNEHAEAWSAEHGGEFVLLRGATLIGFYPTYEEALEAGYERFGLTPFFVRQVLYPERPHFISRLVAPVLAANRHTPRPDRGREHHAPPTNPT